MKPKTRSISWALLVMCCLLVCGFLKSPPINSVIPFIGQAHAIQAPLQAASSGGGQNMNPIQGLHQAMAQMLQVFNGNDSQQLDTNNFKLLKQLDEDTLLVGARNFVYNLSLSTMREQRRLEWTSSEEDVRMCRMKGKSPDQCQNFIRVIEMPTPETLLVCGTNAYKPRCRQYFIGTNDYELTTEMPGEGACPYQENQNVTSTFTDGHLYSATAAQFSGFDGLIHRQPLRTEQFNPKQLNSPNFVSSFRYGEHVYFLFREIAIEHINCGKTIYSRIARVCVNDAGGPATRNRWSSFVKARLNCSIPGDFPFYFDEIQASTHVVSSAYQNAAPLGWGPQAHSGGQHGGPAQDLLYAVFTTPVNSIGGSAVCAYRMQDILAAFEGPFKAQADSNSNWLPVPESRVPQQPRPGSCANDSKRLPEEHINFIKDNPLMDSAVEPIWSQPLITMASINFRFTQVAVDVQVETRQVPGAPAMRTDVIFVATDDGRVFKLINTYHLYASSQAQKVLATGGPPQAAALQLHHGPGPAPPGRSPSSLAQQQAAPGGQFKEPVVDVSASTIVIEELHLFDARTPILGLLIHRPDAAGSPPLAPPGEGKLVVLSSKQIKAVPLARCERALTCQDCLALFDPYCAWDLQAAACLTVGRSAWQSDAGQSQFDPLASPRAPHSRPSPAAAGWFPPNVQPNFGPLPNNHTLGWWSSCPPLAGASQLDLPHPGLQQVGAPVRSLFSSHLQVPSRFDYQSGHHLSRTALVALPQMTAAPSAGGRQVALKAPQPVSECLTFCGGVYTPPPGVGLIDPTASNSLATCADYFGSASTNYFGAAGASSQSLYTSENLYFAVIICALLGLVLGLLFGFAIGKNSRAKAESSICSSTFDETNLYMASTSSHCHPSAGGALFASNARLASHPAFLAAQQQQQQLQQSSNGYALGSQPNNRGGGGGIFDASQCLLATAPSDHSSGLGSSTYANQQQPQQQLFQHPSLPPIRMGALPPIPASQQPLVGGGAQQTTHLNQAQLTPNSSSSQSSSATTTTTSSSSATMQMGGGEQQFYLNQQISAPLTAANKNNHQRSFTNNSVSSHSSAALAKGPASLSSSFQQQASHNANNKIYL